MAAAEGSDEAHVQTKLFTKLKKYKTQETPFSLPTAAGCVELNSLLTTLLFGDEKDKHRVQFDFLINGVFLRSTLNEFIESKNLGTESEVEIEYILKEDDPQLSQTLQHDDWVSAIDIGGRDLILTGSYDSTICLWKLNGECIFSLEGHTMAVKDACWVETTNNASFLSASQDQTILIWEMEVGEKINKQPECAHICRGHAGSVDCIAVSSNNTKFASGSWDKMIKIWDCKVDRSADDEEEEEEAKKQRKATETASRSPSSRTPLITLSGHKEPVSSLLWADDSEIISASWDHCIRLWDAETSINTQTLTSNKVILGIALSSTKSLLATGSVDKYVRLYDPRKSDGAVVTASLSSHNGWVSSVDWSPDNENHLLSGSYDNSVKLWDIRNTDSALLEMEQHKDKVMCVNWSKPGFILSGGADCLVHISEKRSKSPVNSEE